MYGFDRSGRRVAQFARYRKVGLRRRLAVMAAMVGLGGGVVSVGLLSAAPVQADSTPTIASIDTQGCANDPVNVTLTVENSVAGTITLELTGDTAGSTVFVDT